MIDESYNANPASMRASLAVLGAEHGVATKGRRIAVLGAMKELGDFGPSLHAALAEPMMAAKVDFAVLVGDEMAALAQELGKSAQARLARPSPSPIAKMYRSRERSGRLWFGQW
jgi:UDP-N-acetylmuramoyl-tripeptide--D-alanyl-D-alanine ligase